MRYTEVCNPWSAGQKWPGSLHFVARGKVQILKQVLRFLKCIVNLPWMAGELSNRQSLTHAAVARGPIGLCAFARQCCMVAHPYAIPSRLSTTQTPAAWFETSQWSSGTERFGKQVEKPQLETNNTLHWPGRRWRNPAIPLVSKRDTRDYNISLDCNTTERSIVVRFLVRKAQATVKNECKQAVSEKLIKLS